MSGRKLLFLATEDWFVRSHFLPIVRRGVGEGYEVLVAARMSDAQQDLIAAGARVIDLPDERGVYGVAALAAAVMRLRRLIRDERPALVHAISLRPILLASLAALGRRTPKLVLAVTGRGYLATSRQRRAAHALNLAAFLIGRHVRSGRATLLVENEDDRDWVAEKGALPGERVVISPGAGVDLAQYAASPLPPPAPLRVGFVSRLVRSKGVDLAVDAVNRLRARGLDVILSIAGAPDFDNPAAVTPAELQAWSAMPGVRVIGRITDVSGFWAEQHIACLPSRGGEGLPRSLLEAGASARALITTDVPGCRDFVRDGVDGLIAPPDDATALARAIERLAADRVLLERYGASARARVAAGYTTDHAGEAAAAAWRAALR